MPVAVEGDRDPCRGDVTGLGGKRGRVGERVAGQRPEPLHDHLVPRHVDAAKRLRDGATDIVFLGTGCPKQEYFAYDHRHSIKGVQLCVGAAFDFHAGRVSQAPAWMQDRGLEWTYRIAQEPRRLLPRYLYYNPAFLLAFARQLLREKLFRRTS